MPVNIAAPVKYFRPEEGGVTHFHYGRDNALLTWMHMRLFAEFLVRLPTLIARRRLGEYGAKRDTAVRYSA
jgi:hypothetical protein